MKVLLTGATGLIGKRLGVRLVAAGHTLTILTRDANKARWRIPFPAEILEWKGGDLPLERLAQQEAVIHLAGESVADGRWTDEKMQEIRRSRVELTQKLVEQFHRIPKDKRSLKAFVLGSAIGWYGHRGDEICLESDPPGEAFLSKLVVDWEAAGRSIQKNAPVRFVAVRTGLVMSSQGGALEKMVPIFRRGLGGQVGNGRQYMSWIHLDDICGIFQFCLENPVDGPVNGVAPRPETNASLTQALAAVLDRPAIFPVPVAALKIAVGGIATELISSQRVSADEIQKLGYKFQYSDLHACFAHLFGDLSGERQELFREQWVPKKPDEVWSFFGSETNLEAITPKYLNFKVLEKTTPSLEKGTLLDYRLSVHGIPMRWQTEITEWSPPKSFADRQTRGPYKLWSHTHTFEPLGSGTLIRDRVVYELPLKWLGSLAGDWMVRRDLKVIFDFRQKVIGEKYGTP